MCWEAILPVAQSVSRAAHFDTSDTLAASQTLCRSGVWEAYIGQLLSRLKSSLVRYPLSFLLVSVHSFPPSCRARFKKV